MDVAYDHIQEEVLSPDEIARKEAGEKQKESNLNTEFQEAYKSFSASPWGAKLGGFFSDVKKQGMPYYEGAKQQGGAASGEALKGFTSLRTTIVNRARSMSTGQNQSATSSAGAWDDETVDEPEMDAKDKDTSKGKERTESEALRESEGVLSRFRAEAAKRLKDLEKAEEAADAAIFKFGANIGNFLRDAVTVAPPTEETNKDGSRKILFESKDQDGKRVIHTTRFDAQLHAIHSSLDSFTKDPVSPEFEKWKDDFDVEKKTGAIASDLEKYTELRRTMEKLVPEKVEYPVFWTRYYFLRMVVETEEQRRREMLKGRDTVFQKSTGSMTDSPQVLPTTPLKQLAGGTTQTTKNPLLHNSALYRTPLFTHPIFRQHLNHLRLPYTSRQRQRQNPRRSSLRSHAVPKKAAMLAMILSAELPVARLVVQRKPRRAMTRMKRRIGSNA